ncbi:MAG: WG repeat-containing protein, partial [Saprospiraceae bacterium]|nr:WG repeat-containing protein [Saprospiraceae bacterium]
MQAKVRFLLFLYFLFTQILHAQVTPMSKPTHPNMTDFWKLNDQRVAYLEDDYWGLMDASGNAITNPEFNFIKPVEQNLYGFQDPYTEMWGIMNADGETVVEPEYDEISEAQEGFMRVSRISDVDSKPEYNFLTPDGELASPKFFKYLSNVQDGLAVFSNNKLFGYMTPTGTVLIPEKFKSAQPFRNGMAAAKMDDAKGWGFVDKKGQWVIQPQFPLVAEDYKSNLIKVGQASSKQGDFEVEWGLIDRQGKVVLDRMYQIIELPSENGVMLVKRNELYGYVNSLGQTITECIYKNASSHSKEGLARVEKDGKWGFVNSKGAIVIPITFDAAEHFSENMAAVQKDGKWGFINTQGQLVVPHKFIQANPFKNGRSAVLLDTEVAVIDKTGNTMARSGVYSNTFFTTQTHLFVQMEESIVLFDDKGQRVKRLNYNDIGDFSDGLALVLTNGMYGYMNTNGETVIPLKYAAATVFSEGLAAVQENETSAAYFIDKTGKKVIDLPVGYEYFGNFSEGMASVAYKGLGGFIDRTGSVKVPAKYTNLTNFKNGMAIVQNDLGKQGFIDSKGVEVIPPAYDECGNMSEDGLAWVKLNNKFGFVNRTGKLVIPAEYEAVSNFVKGVAGVR